MPRPLPAGSPRRTGCPRPQRLMPVRQQHVLAVPADRQHRRTRGHAGSGSASVFRLQRRAGSGSDGDRLAQTGQCLPDPVQLAAHGVSSSSSFICFDSAIRMISAPARACPCRFETLRQNAIARMPSRTHEQCGPAEEGNERLGQCDEGQTDQDQDDDPQRDLSAHARGAAAKSTPFAGGGNARHASSLLTRERHAPDPDAQERAREHRHAISTTQAATLGFETRIEHDEGREPRQLAGPCRQ